MQRIHKLLHSPRPLKWLFYGDSITHGSVHTFGARDYTELFSERLRAEMTRTQDIVIKSALSGNTTSSLLDEFNWRVEQFQPDVVFLMIGINDCKPAAGVSPEKFRLNLLDLCRRTLNIGAALPVLQTTNPVLPCMAPEREPHLALYMEIVRTVASELDLPLIDHHRLWKETEVQKPKLIPCWMSDALHPNHFGHIVFAHFIFEQLGIFEPDSATCSFFHP